MKNKSRLSFIVLILVAIIELSAALFYYPKWKNKGTEATISWDASGYYMYLPAIFIYHDLKKCGFQNYVLNEYQPTPDFQQAFLHSSGNYVMKYSSGQAIMLSPAFFIAHAYTKLTHKYPADGFSLPYQFCVAMWTLLLSFVGLFALRKILLAYFDDKIVAFTIFSVALCTNYFDYATFSGAMTHSTLFTLYAVLLLVTKKFYEQPKIFLAVLIGALCGLATITRPTEIISVAIPICWGIANAVSLRERIDFFKREKLSLLFAALAFLLIASVQLVYWKYVSGEWFVYSYQKQGFDWFRPHIYKCLFSVQAGWLLYSPIMALAIIGFYFLYREKRFLFWSCLVFAAPFTYLCFAWSEWWYGWSLGQRAMIQSYSIWAFLLAMSFQKLFESKFRKIALAVILFLSFIYNVWLVLNSHKNGLLRGPEMTDAYFFAIFGRMSVPEKTVLLLDNPDALDDNTKTTTTIYTNDFSNDTSANVFTDSSMNKKIRLDNSLQYSQEYFLNEQFKKVKWYKISADFTSQNKEWNTWRMCQFTIHFYDRKQELKSNMIRVFRLLSDNETRNIQFFAKAPKKNFNNISVSFWNAESDKEIVIDNLKVEIIENP